MIEVTVTLAALTTFVVKHSSIWLTALGGVMLDMGRGVAVDAGKEIALGRGKGLIDRIFHPDEKVQLRHLEQALKNATERGLARYDTLHERDVYKSVIYTLSEPGPQGDLLRREVMQLFSLSEKPDLVALNDLYNKRQRFYDANHTAIEAAPYLDSFFSALLGELYADPLFRPQLSDVLQQRANASMQHSLLEIVTVLRQIGETLVDAYTVDEFERDVLAYTSYIERTTHNLKIVGAVPKDLNADPELNGIFVPLRLSMSSSRAVMGEDTSPTEMVAALEKFPYLVVLGGPGSGKSTATKYLAWSHAAANQAQLSGYQIPLLSGNPLPLRIELRRLLEGRRHENYDFLSFATEVLLKREGIKIRPQMFRELLQRRCLLLLFDGLDEVATIDDRLQLVSEIEHFAQYYPGNRVLVTSRPVGYDLARVSHPLFAHAEVKPFDAKQIGQFLHNWYTAVLRLSPIPQKEQDELDLLLTTLKDNSRMRKLAENPLLLTVITALHRYERLPDRRVLVYDRCADLLLQTWAKLKGTDKRWQDMKMDKDTQYACVACLGFTLHIRAQEKDGAREEKDVSEHAVDVPDRMLSQEVQKYLRKHKLIAGGTEQRQEANRFISLVQEEAGLIVERGIDENGEPLYGFVHRTFQEYFAAADVYERYAQAEDRKVISKFLQEHLHDPHWEEVILLLLGKLKSTPVTTQLNDILKGKLKSKRSYYTDIMQQDLFFVCRCLIEEIRVDISLVELVVKRLCHLIKETPFLYQCRMALKYLALLMQTKQYANIGKQELIGFATRKELLDVDKQLEALQILYLYCSEIALENDQKLKELMEQVNLSVEQLWKMAESLYLVSPKGSVAEQRGIKLLEDLVQRPELSVEQLWKTAASLCSMSPEGSESQQQGIKILEDLVQRPELPVEQMQEIAESLYLMSPKGSVSQQQGIKLLEDLVQRPGLSVEQIQEIAEALYHGSSEGSESRQQGIKLLEDLVQRPGLSVEQIQKTAASLYRMSPKGSVAEQRGIKLLEDLVQRPGLSVGQLWKIAVSLYRMSPKGSADEQWGMKLLEDLVQGSELSVEQIQETAEALCRVSPKGSVAEQWGMKLLEDLIQRPELSVEQLWKIAVSLCHVSPKGSGGEQRGIKLLEDLIQRPELSAELVGQTAQSLYLSYTGSTAKLLITSYLLHRLKDCKKSAKWDAYNFLASMVPYFHKLSLIAIHEQS